MPVHPCPNPPVNCPGFDGSPVINNSSEAPDPFQFWSDGFVPDFLPPLGWNWGNPDEYGVCYNPTSVELASECAIQVARQQQHNRFIPPNRQPNPHPRPHTVFNDEQNVQATCPDGTPSFYTVSAGMFSGGSKAAANEAAQEWGMQQATLHLLCLSEIDSPVCVGVFLSQSIFASSAFLAPPGVNEWSISVGALPDGLSIDNPDTGPATISGTPSAPGDFNFTILVQLPNGDNTQKDYFMTVAGITNVGTLPQFQSGTPYNASLLTTGFRTPQFQITSGILPDGLNMDRSGNISGTPSSHAVTETFAVQVTDGITGFQCTQNITLTQHAGCSPLPTQLFSYATPASGPGDAGMAFRSNYGVHQPLLVIADTNNQIYSLNVLTQATQGPVTSANNYMYTVTYYPVTDTFYAFGIDFNITGDILVDKIQPQPLADLTSIDLGPSPGGLANLWDSAYSTSTHLIYVVLAQGLLVFDPSTDSLVTTIDLSGTGNYRTIGKASIDEANKLLYFGYCNTDLGENYLMVWDISTPVPTQKHLFPVSAPANSNTQPSAIFVPGHNLVYVLQQLANTHVHLLTMDATTGAILKDRDLGTTFSTSPSNLPAYNPVADLVLFPLAGLAGPLVLCPSNDSVVGSLPIINANKGPAFDSLNNSICWFDTNNVDSFG